MYYSSPPAEQAFLNSGTCFHLYTKPLENNLYFHSEKERRLAVNYLAIAVTESACKLLAYSIMTNHFHFILSGEREQALLFFDRYRQLLNNYYSRHGRGCLLNQTEARIKAIDNLKQMRNEIAYVIRNAFVVSPDVNVFADPWSSGFLYFNPLLILEGTPASALSGRALREFTCSRSISALNEGIFVKDGMAQPWSFVDYQLVMSFYDNARQFIYATLKNVDAQVELSLTYGETPSLTDEDLLPVLYKLCRENLKTDDPFKLDLHGKQRLAVLLKNKYYASNGQIARLTKLPLQEVNKLFPLVAKDQIK